MLKVQDAKAVDVQKALQAAGIKVTSIIEVHKEASSEDAWLHRLKRDYPDKKFNYSDNLCNHSSISAIIFLAER